MRSLVEKPDPIGQPALRKPASLIRGHDGRGSTLDSSPRAGHEFSRVSITASGGGADSQAGEVQPTITRQRHTVSVVIPRAGDGRSDDIVGNARGPVPDTGLSASGPPLAGALETPSPHLDTGARRHFFTLPQIALSTLPDAISATLAYNPSINPVAAPAAPTKFGDTTTNIAVNKSSGLAQNGGFLVDFVVENIITYWVAGGNRRDIASPADRNITQANYPAVVSDLTPSPVAVRTGGLDLYKNQPRRTQFWARDLTLAHEIFHADENERFGRAGAIVARDWLRRQTAQTLDQVEVLVGGASRVVAQHIMTAMAPPGVEQRAYDDGAAAYTARANAIQAKGAAGGY